jgi:hypothetical protein
VNTRYNNNNKTFEQCRRQLFKAVCVCVCVCVFLCAHTIHPCVHSSKKKKNSKKTLNKKTPEIFSLFVFCLLFETHTKHLRDAFVRRPTLHSRKERGFRFGKESASGRTTPRFFFFFFFFFLFPGKGVVPLFWNASKSALRK